MMRTAAPIRAEDELAAAAIGAVRGVTAGRRQGARGTMNGRLR